MNVKDVKLSPEQWVALLQKFGVPASSLTGKGAPCPICGGDDRFTYDNKRGRGDWVCRKCNDGDLKAGDGFELICKAAGISFRELMAELDGGVPAVARRASNAPAPRRKVDPAWAQKRLDSMWERANAIGRDDLQGGEKTFPDGKRPGKTYESFCLTLEHRGETHILQGEGLRDAIAETHCRIGDRVEVRRLGKTKVPAVDSQGHPKLDATGAQILWDKWLWSISKRS